MTVTWWGELDITVEAALSAATGSYGVWDAATWDTATWGPDEQWTDITAWTRKFSSTRKFSREVQAWEAGTASVVLDNRDGRFSMDKLSGPYVVAGVSGVRPWRPIRVRVTVAGVTYSIFRMYAKDWVEGYTKAPAGQGDAWVTVPCADEMARLAAVNNPAAGSQGSGELFGPRLHRWLNAAGHTGERVIDEGSVTMQATTLANSTATGIRLTADSEGGAVWVEADGSVVGARQYALVEDTRSVESQATFGDATGEIPYADIELSSPGDQITNVVSYARVGGTAQVAADATSRALYGDRTDPRTDLLCETDAQTAKLAAWKVARFKVPERRVTAITIDPRRDDVPWAVALGSRVRDLVTVVRRPPGGYTITQYCHIAGVRHDVSRNPERWRTTFYLSSATPYRQFASSRWDVGTWGSVEGDPAGSLWFY